MWGWLIALAPIAFATSYWAMSGKAKQMMHQSRR